MKIPRSLWLRLSTMGMSLAFGQLSTLEAVREALALALNEVDKALDSSSTSRR